MLSTFVGFRVRAASAAYADVTLHVDHLRALQSVDPTTLSPATLSQANAEFQALRSGLDRFDEATAVPGIQIISALAWIGDRYTAMHDLLAIGLLAGDAGAIATTVGSDVLLAVDTSGGGATDSGAWLTAIAPHQHKLQSVLRDLEDIRAIRARLDDTVLPERVRAQLLQLDRVVDRPELRSLAELDMSSALKALGGSGAS